MLIITDVLFSISERFNVGPIQLQIEKGTHAAIIGESGCGKTTLLQMIYGLYDLDQGSITFDNKKVTGPEENLIPGMPYIKYLSQDFDLMPYTSVTENIHKYLSRLEPETSQARTEELLEVVEMTPFASAHVKTLSGGQKQRVALAQTLAKEPELLLLDEPFSHIDNFRKNKLRRRLFAYLKKQNITCLVATHDSTDVLSYMDKTVAMRDGIIIAHEQTQKLYDNPPSYYVGSLFGDLNKLPKQWFFPDAQKDEQLLRYPHQLTISPEGIKVEITKSYFMGTHYLIEALCDGQSILFNSESNLVKGDTTYINLK